MTTITQTKDQLSALLISRWEQVAYKLAALADEFPDRDGQLVVYARVNGIVPPASRV